MGPTRDPFRLLIPTVLCVWIAFLPTPAIAQGGAGVPESAEQEARALLHQVLEARGGVESFWRLAEVRRYGTLVIATSNGERSLALRMTVRPPDRLTLETGDGDELVRRTLGPSGAYQTTGGGEPVEIDASDTDHLRRLIRIDEAFLVRNALAGVLRPMDVGPAGPGQLPEDMEVVSGRSIRIRGPQGQDYRLVLPEEGGLPRRIDYASHGPEDEKRDVTDLFMDWRDVDGLLFPFETVMFEGGKARMLVRYDRVEVDLAPTPVSQTP
jgi:hypothetical protein